MDSGWGLEKNTRYFFVVSSVTNTTPPVESQYSREVMAGTTAAPAIPVIAQSQVQNEGVIDIAQLIGMASFPMTADIKGYNIYISEVKGGKYEKYNEQPLGNIPSYKIHKLKPGQQYFFTIRTVGKDGSESAASREVPAVAMPSNATR